MNKRAEEEYRIRYNLGQWLFWLYVPLAVLGKVIRWTALKATTADMGIGHGMATTILRGDTSFLFAWEGGNATSNANYIFSIFNLFNCQTYEEFEIGISIVYNLVLLWLLYEFTVWNHGINLKQFIFIAMLVGVLNVYVLTLSKESAQLIYFLLFYFLMRYSISEKNMWIFSLGIILLMMITTRFYYVLMLAFAVGIRMVYPSLHRNVRGKSVLILLLFLLVAGISYYLFLTACQVLSPEDYVQLIRVRTRTSLATTDIQAWLPTETLEMFSINYFVTAIRMLFPLELLRFGPLYYVYVLFQCMLSSFVIQSLLHYSESHPVKQIALCLYWGFFFCSVAFEPDFGSWVRHESVTFPLLLFVLADYQPEDDRTHHLLLPA